MTSSEHRSDAAILGRMSVNDVDTIVDICRANPYSTETEHIVPDASDALFTWDYDKGARPKLEKLYEKGKTSQWNANDLPWHLEVDPRTIFRVGDQLPPTREDMAGDPSSPLHKWGDKEWEEYRTEAIAWRLSQFLHGEQGALLCTAKIVETVPWIDAKYYAATQVVDEARHVEVFGRYLRTKLNSEYPINPHLRLLLDDNGAACGVAAINVRSGAMQAIPAKAVIICTGGGGRIFPFTTSAAIKTGAGMSMAYRAGGPLKDKEFVQYHPTGLPGTGARARPGR